MRDQETLPEIKLLPHRSKNSEKQQHEDILTKMTLLTVQDGDRTTDPENKTIFIS